MFKKLQVFLFFIFCFSQTSIFSNSFEEEDSTSECSMIFDLLFPEEEEEKEVFVEGMDLIDRDRMPRHIFISTDGNRRWAKRRGMDASEGHWSGAKNIKRIVKFAAQLGVKVVTLGLYSAENSMKRSKEEVSELMEIMAHYVNQKKDVFSKYSIRLKTIGDLSVFPFDLQESIRQLEQETSSESNLTVVVGLNYSAKDEMRRAIKKIARDLEEGLIHEEEISEKLITRYLDTVDIEDPDLYIRTSGEQRLSNSGTWQMAYTELYFTPVLWPDFSE